MLRFIWWVTLVQGIDASVRGIGSTTFANRLENAIALFQAPIQYTRSGSGAAVQCALDKKPDCIEDFFIVDDALNWDIDWAKHDVDVFPVSMLTISTVVGNSVGHQYIPKDTLVKIMAAEITFWDHVNTSLPHVPITVCGRSDNSGTKKSYHRWLGTDPIPSIARHGNLGVASCLLDHPYAIGFLAVDYADSLPSLPTIGSDVDPAMMIIYLLLPHAQRCNDQMVQFATDYIRWIWRREGTTTSTYKSNLIGSTLHQLDTLCTALIPHTMSMVGNQDQLASTIQWVQTYDRDKYVLPTTRAPDIVFEPTTGYSGPHVFPNTVSLVDIKRIDSNIVLHDHHSDDDEHVGRTGFDELDVNDMETIVRVNANASLHGTVLSTTAIPSTLIASASPLSDVELWIYIRTEYTYDETATAHALVRYYWETLNARIDLTIDGESIIPSHQHERPEWSLKLVSAFMAIVLVLLVLISRVVTERVSIYLAMVGVCLIGIIGFIASSLTFDSLCEYGTLQPMLQIGVSFVCYSFLLECRWKVHALFSFVTQLVMHGVLAQTTVCEFRYTLYEDQWYRSNLPLTDETHRILVTLYAVFNGIIMLTIHPKHQRTRVMGMLSIYTVSAILLFTFLPYAGSNDEERYFVLMPILTIGDMFNVLVVVVVVFRPDQSIETRTAWRSKRVADEARAKSENLLQTILENVPWPIHVSSSNEHGNQRFDYVSPSTMEFMGLTKEELERRPMSEQIHPEDLSKAREYIANGDFNEPMRQRVRLGNGEYAWVENTMAYLNDDRLMLIARPIDSEMELSRVRQKSSELAVYLDSNEHLFCARCTHDGVFEWTTKSSKAMYGYESMVGMNGWEHVHLDDLESLMAESKVRTAETVWNAPMRFRRRCADGAYKWVESRGLKTAKSWVVMERIVEAEIERDMMVGMLDHIDVGLVETQGAPHYEIVRVSDGWCRITGYRREDVIGLKGGTKFLQCDETSERTVQGIREDLIHGNDIAVVIRNQRKNGERFWCRMTAKRMPNGGYGATVSDVSEQYERESGDTHELRQLIESANAPIFGIDVEGRVNEWNDTTAGITGYTKNETMDKSLLNDFITDESRESVRAVLESALRGEERANYELEFATKGGARRQLLLNATTRRDLKGKVTGVVGVAQDITDAKLAEQRLQTTAVELRQLIDKANAPIFGVDTKCCVNEWNATTERITGYTKEEALGRPLVEMLVSAENKRSQSFRNLRSAMSLNVNVTKVLQSALCGEETSNYQLEFQTKGGEARQLLVNATSRRDKMGQITGVVGVGQDMTESYARAAELRQLIDKANAPILGVGMDGKVTEWNETTARITGYSKEETLGRSLLDAFITDESRESVRAVLESALRGQERANYELEFATKGGARRQLLLNATTRRDLQGNVTGVVGVAQDITDMLSAKEEALRTRERVDVERGLNEYLSHEVRNPLSVAVDAVALVQGLVDKGENDDEKMNEYVDLIRQSNTYILELVTNMLDLNKCMEGRLELVMSRISIRDEILKPVTSMLKANEKRLQITMECGDEYPVTVDKLRLKQVVMNLGANAVKFVPKGEVRIGCKRVSEQNVLLWVEDTGPGIPVKMRARLFERYATLGHSYQGTGLGLCFGWNVVNQMGGELRYNSEYTDGARFEIQLPLAKTSLTPVRTSQSLVTLCVPRGRMLLIDDDEQLLKTLRLRFEQLCKEWTVDTLKNGEEMEIESVLKRDYDLILVDYYMGPSGGVETGDGVVRRLRGAECGALIVGYSGNDKEFEFKNAGAALFWRKPLPMNGVLVRVLNEHLPLPRRWRVLLVDDEPQGRTMTKMKLSRLGPKWVFDEAGSGEEAKSMMETHAYDLAVFDQQLGGEVTGLDCVKFGRDLGQAGIFVGYSGNDMKEAHESAGCDVSWTKPSPPRDRMRRDLMRALMNKQRIKSMLMERSSVL